MINDLTEGFGRGLQTYIKQIMIELKDCFIQSN
jgi:hypothetical protein